MMNPRIGSHPHVIAGLDAFLLGQLLADLHELFRLHDRIEPCMLGPEVEMLGEPVGGRHIRKLVRLAERLPVALEHPRRRIGARLRIVRMQRIVGERRFHRFVVLGERAFRHLVDGEEARHAFRVHDERIHAFLGRRVGLDVGNVRAGPFFRGGVPGDQLAFRIVRLAGDIAGGAVVEDAPIGRPGIGPVERLPQAERIGVVAPRHQVALLRPAAGEHPAAARGGTVVAQFREAVQLLAGLDQHLGLVLGIGHILQRLAGEFLRQFLGQKAHPAGDVSRSGSGSGRGKRRRLSCTSRAA